MAAETMVHLLLTETSRIDNDSFLLLLFFFYCNFTFRLYAAHSLSIVFCVFELVPFVLGVTSITFARSFLGM